ncbi:diguanylate cyclase [Butyricicoccus sp. 1XD8-22]|nr:diguanylate cyclase [Butyricicoccus sp. 1XD8-22]
MINAFKEPFYIENYQLYATANIGVSTFPENRNNSIELIRNANLALYKSQKAGKNKYHIISHLSSIQSFKSTLIYLYVGISTYNLILKF